MRVFTALTLIFIIGGSLGWCIELIFRRIVHKKWINPGFLVGPCLPLYGVGVILLFSFCLIDFSFIESETLRSIVAVLLLTIALTLVEYITGLIFIKGLKVKLWDYSNRPGNIQGIICPLFTVFWALIAAVYYLFLNDFILRAAEWIDANPIYSFFVGMYFGVFVVDVFYSFHVVTRIRKWANDKQVVVKLEELKFTIRQRAEKLKEKSSFIFPFKGKRDISEELDSCDEASISQNKR